MSKTVKYILISICSVLILSVLVAAYILGASRRTPLKCTGLRVEISDSTVNRFVSVADVRKYIDKRSYLGVHPDSIDLAGIERIIDGKSAVLKSQAYTTRDGFLNIKVSQRTPILRLQMKNGGFYADSDGYLFPLQASYSSRVPVIDGEIPLTVGSGYEGMPEKDTDREWLEKAMELVIFMEGNKEWKEKFVQITVCKGGDFVLVPRRGKERFLFGQPEEIEKKFGKIARYYTTILPEKGSVYTSVNIKFADQIICR